mmetsp:Transcript_27644/g.87869  ORF Transcript_27644/g.87869 Transcript_27644/m.87869 type:complete len:201 (+) Transcript_27644:130-732(+)
MVSLEHVATPCAVWSHVLERVSSERLLQQATTQRRVRQRGCTRGCTRGHTRPAPRPRTRLPPRRTRPWTAARLPQRRSRPQRASAASAASTASAVSAAARLRRSPPCALQHSPRAAEALPQEEVATESGQTSLPPTAAPAISGISGHLGQSLDRTGRLRRPPQRLLRLQLRSELSDLRVGGRLDRLELSRRSLPRAALGH